MLRLRSALTLRPPLAVLVAALVVGCGPNKDAGTLEQRPKGVHGEVLSWTVDVPADGGSHAMAVGIDTDPAQLLGWARRDRSARVVARCSLTAPDGAAVTRTVELPVMELHKLSEDKAANVVRVTHDAAGAPLPNGFRRVPAVDVLTFTPTLGKWTLEVELTAPPRADRRTLKAIRSVRVELRSTREGSVIRAQRWKALPLRLPE